MSSNFLIEADNFVCAQLTIENIQNILDLLSSSNYFRYEFSYHDYYFDSTTEEDGSALSMTISNDKDKMVISDGDYIVRLNDDIFIFSSIDDVFSAYEKNSNITLTSDSTEDKLREIVFSRFFNRAREYKDIYTSFPYASSLDDFIERGRDGFSTRDWYNFCYYFANVMVNMAEKFKNEGSGFPIINDPLANENITDEAFIRRNESDWNNMLDAIIDGFGGVVKYDDMSEDEQMVARDKLNVAFDIIKSYYFNLWD